MIFKNFILYNRLIYKGNVMNNFIYREYREKNRYMELKGSWWLLKVEKKEKEILVMVIDSWWLIFFLNDKYILVLESVDNWENIKILKEINIIF